MLTFVNHVSIVVQQKNPGRVDFQLIILTDGNPYRVEEVEEVEELSVCSDFKTFCICFNSHAYREHDKHLFY